MKENKTVFVQKKAWILGIIKYRRFWY